MRPIWIGLAVLALAAAPAWAQDVAGKPPLRIGVLADMSGTTADLGGRGSVVAESHAPWNLYKISRTLPGEALLPPESETACPTAR